MFGDRLQKVYAFEPNVQTYPLLQQNLKAMGLFGQAQTFPCGVADSPRELRFTENKTMIYIDPEGTTSISVRTIDESVEEVTGDLSFIVQ